MRLIETIYELILEARPKEIYNKYYSDIEFPQATKLNTKVVLFSGETQQNLVVKKQRIGKKA